MGMFTYQAVCFSLLLVLHSGAGDSLALKEVGTRFFEWRMRERPLQATRRNIYTYNDQIEHFSTDKLDQNKEMAENLMEELRNITKSDLEYKETIQYDILHDMLNTFISGYDFKDYTYNPVNFLEGIQRDPLAFVNSIPFTTIGDYENYISRLRKMSDQLREFDSLMLMAIRKNTTLHKVSVEPVLGQIEALLVSDVTKSVFFSPLTKLEDTSITRKLWSDIRRDGYEAVRAVIQAYRQFHTWLYSTYLPRTRKAYGVDVEYYRACLKWHTSLQMTPEEVHQLGLREVDRIKENMNQILENQNFTGTIAEYFESLRDDRRFFKSDPADIVEEFRTIMSDRIDPFLGKMFKKLPKYNIKVVPMLADGPAARYRAPSPDGKTPGQFVVNLLRPTQMPVYTFMSLAMNEANPGRHLQTSLAMAEDTPDFMRFMETPHMFQTPYAFPPYLAFTEGWALYAESLGEEFGLYKDDFELMGRYSSEIFRAARLVVDTGLHYYGWEREEAIEYLMNLTAKTRPFIEVEVDRYITWPAQSCSYKVGELTIKNLRKQAEEALGDEFDIREFHAAVLDNGYKPLNLLTTTVREWTVRYNTNLNECASSAIRVLSMSLFSILGITLMCTSIYL